MTGYGRGERTDGGLGVTVEVRSVNHRFLDVQLKLPRAWMSLESRLVSLIRERLGRGRVDVFVKRLADDSGVSIEADLEVARLIRSAAESLAQELKLEGGLPDVSQLIGMQGVLVSREADVDADAEAGLVEAALASALDLLCGMRATEGVRMVADVRTHLDRVDEIASEIGGLAADVPTIARSRLERRIAELLEGTRVEFDQDRIVQEAALVADKADIGEELVRLASHVAQARDLLEKAEPVGRRLEFLVQELGRETNTVGSKSSETGISARVVELKSALEKIREQVANIE